MINKVANKMEIEFDNKMEIEFDNGFSPQLRIANRAEKLFPNGCHRILFVLPPESPESYFDPELVLAKRYPSFPPYGSGVLSRKLKERLYTPGIIDLNYHLLRMVHEDLENFNY